MKNWQNAVLLPTASIIDAVKLLDREGGQICLIVDADGRLRGTVTDGDIRRGLLAGVTVGDPVTTVMNANPVTIRPGDNRKDAMGLLRRKLLRHVPVLDADGRVIGLETPEELQHSMRRPNWVVLMAGGEGQRLRPLTEEVPKPLIKVGGRPILETILLNFAAHGFTKFFISVNYMADQVISHFGDGSQWNVEIHYICEEQKMGTAGALSLLPEAPTDNVFVMNGDILTNINLEEMLDFHQSRHVKATMCIREHVFNIPYGVIDVCGDGFLSRIEEKPVIKNHVNAGIYVISPEAIAMVPSGVSYTMPDLFRRLIEHGHSCGAFPLKDYWIDVGRFEDLDRANVEFPKVFG